MTEIEKLNIRIAELLQRQDRLDKMIKANMERSQAMLELKTPIKP